MTPEAKARLHYLLWGVFLQLASFLLWFQIYATWEMPVTTANIIMYILTSAICGYMLLALLYALFNYIRVGRVYPGFLKPEQAPIPQPLLSPEHDYEGDMWRAFGEAHAVPPEDVRSLIVRERLPFTAVLNYAKALPPQEPAHFTVPLYEAVNIRQLLYDVFSSLPNDTPNYRLYHQQCVRLSAENPKAGFFMWPQHFEGTNEQIIREYLKDNPLKPLFEVQVPFALKDTTRFEHQWVLAGTGHGKTQTLQHMILHDLERVKKGECSIVVLDSQDKMIPLITEMDFPADQLILLEPRKAPPAINLLRLKSDNLNELFKLYQFVFGDLLSQDMTANQLTLFENCVTLLRENQGTTLRDLYDILRPGPLKGYANETRKLDKEQQQFFKEDFGASSYESTKQELRRRLNTLFRASPFKEMFSSQENRLDLFQELNDAKVVLVNTAGIGDGTRLFGRFVLALIANVMRQRQGMEHPKPCFIYIDECDQYVRGDATAIELLARARKTNIGLIFAHRWLDEVGEPVAKALESTASIVFAGGIRGVDVPFMARVMDLPRERQKLLSRPTKGLYTAYVRGQPIASLQVKFFEMEHAQKRDAKPIRQKQYEKWGAKSTPPVVEDIYE